ncbi:MAG: lysozyme [Erythrobacter sp.]|nr:MAG: lysozyme [Erythrobacter sp.]
MSRPSLFDLARLLLRFSSRTRPVPAAETISLDSAPCAPYSPANTPGQIGPEGVALIKRFEGCAKRRTDGMIEAYPDPGSGGAPWTIGWGATGPGIARGTVWTQARCDTRLEEDLIRYANEVARVLDNAPTTQSQFDALVSFHYNTGAIARATLTRKHKAGDFAGAAREFDRWCHAGGRVMKGLVRRRAAESELYRRG